MILIFFFFLNSKQKGVNLNNNVYTLFHMLPIWTRILKKSEC